MPAISHRPVILARWLLPPLTAAALVVGAGEPAAAAPDNAAGFAARWLVSTVDGRGRFRPSPDAPWQPLLVGTAADPGSEIELGRSAQVTLLAGGDMISAGDGATLWLTDLGRERTAVEQRRGRARYAVEPTGRPRFEVTTPQVALTVKGTVFTVAVDAGGSATSVERGIVAVATRHRGNPVDLRAGQGAMVGARTGGMLRVGLLTNDRIAAEPAPNRGEFAVPAPASTIGAAPVTTPTARRPEAENQMGDATLAVLLAAAVAAAALAVRGALAVGAVLVAGTRRGSARRDGGPDGRRPAA